VKSIVVIFTFLVLSIGFVLNAEANPIVVGKLRIDLFNEDVNIGVSKQGDKLVSDVTCKATMSVGIPGLNWPDMGERIEVPQDLIIHFPIPENAQDIKVIVKTEDGSERELEYEVIENPYPEFKDFKIIRCKLPISEAQKLEIDVSYSHELSENEGKYLLRYAFGTGKVFTKRYESIDLLIKLPSDSNVVRYRPMDLSLSSDEEGVYLRFHSSEWFYLPRRNVEVIFTLGEPMERRGTSIEVPEVQCGSGRFAKITAILKDSDDNPLSDKPVKFYMDGVYKGRARTNDDGEARLVCFVMAPSERRIEIKAIFEGDAEYEPSEGIGSMQIEAWEPPTVIIPVLPIRPVSPPPIVSPRIKLGRCPLGKLVRRKFKLRNIADSPLHLKLKLEGDGIDDVIFKLGGGRISSLNLPPNGEVEIELLFKPKSRGRLIPRLIVSDGSSDGKIGEMEFMMEGVLFGDVSGDGRVTPYDAVFVLRHIVGLETLSQEALEAADVSGDGRITAYDGALILRRVVGLIEKFPVEKGL
jgi:hypothetical protein